MSYISFQISSVKLRLSVCVCVCVTGARGGRPEGVVSRSDDGRRTQLPRQTLHSASARRHGHVQDERPTSASVRRPRLATRSPHAARADHCEYLTLLDSLLLTGVSNKQGICEGCGYDWRLSPKRQPLAIFFVLMYVSKIVPKCALKFTSRNL